MNDQQKSVVSDPIIIGKRSSRKNSWVIILLTLLLIIYFFWIYDTGISFFGKIGLSLFFFALAYFINGDSANYICIKQEELILINSMFGRTIANIPMHKIKKVKFYSAVRSGIYIKIWIGDDEIFLDEPLGINSQERQDLEELLKKHGIIVENNT